MSNNNPNLELIGVKYVIDDSTVAAAVQRIQNQLQQIEKGGAKAIQSAAAAFGDLAAKANLVYNEKANRFIDTQTRLFVSHAEAVRRVQAVLGEYSNTLDRQIEAQNQSNDKFNASRQSVRFFAADLAQATGVGGEFSSIIGRMASAIGPLDVALAAIIGGITLFKQASEQQDEIVNRNVASLARLATSYDEYAAARKRAVESQPLSSDNLLSMIDAFNEGAKRGSPIIRDYLNGMEALNKALFGPQTIDDRFRRATDDIRKGELALGEIANDRVIQQGKAIQKAAEEGASLSQLKDMVVQLWVAEGQLSEATLKDERAMTRLAPALLEAAKGWQTFGFWSNDAKRSMEALAGLNVLIAQTEAANRAQSEAIDNQIGNAVLQMQDMQKAFQQESEDADAAHQDRLRDIEAAGNERRVELSQSLADRMASIDADLAQARIDAAKDLNDRLAQLDADAADRRADLAAAIAERLADADASANDRRAELAQTLADRRADIERQYQEQLRSIQQSYAASIEDAEISRDAKAIVQARRTRERQLAEAQHQRDQSNAQASRDYAKQQADLDLALAKQKAALQRDYQRQVADFEKNLAKQQEGLRKDYAKRLQDLEANARKQRAQAQSDFEKQLKQLNDNLTKQRNAENDSFGKQQAARATAFEDRRKQLAQALGREGKLTDDYVTRVQEAFKKILDPVEYKAFVQALQDAFNATINVKITSNAPVIPPAQPPGGGGRPFAIGGMVDGAAPVHALLHPPELVLPLNNMARTDQLLQSYLAPRAGRAGGLTAARGRVDVFVHPELNEGLLSVKVRAIADDQMVRVFTEAGAQLGAGAR